MLANVIKMTRTTNTAMYYRFIKALAINLGEGEHGHLTSEANRNSLPDREKAYDALMLTAIEIELIDVPVPDTIKERELVPA